MDLITRLQTIDGSCVDRFSFDGIETYAKVVSIHDPDTVTIVFEWNNQLIKLNVRLDGIDAPELKSKVPAESAACRAGTLRLQELINNKVVKVILGKFDKFGRVLSTIHTLHPIDDEITCINDYLIQYQYVRSYDGGKKLAWCKKELAAAGTKKTKLS